MSDVLVDSSVVAKWFLPETDTPKAEQLLIDVTLKGNRLVVLDLALVEVANAIWKQHHRGLASAADSRQQLQKLESLTNLYVEPAQRLLQPALEIGLKYDRAIYDALFVALADDLKISSVTADEPLHNAVKLDFPNIILLRDW
ncbi:MAG: type II toxin-antitoxin system VapC family toxin [Gemmataceae bacterium]|nr:type II toxin-antitoxin system VapC family toxin [Gemmataceae bacterium]